MGVKHTAAIDVSRRADAMSKRNFLIAYAVAVPWF